MTLSQEEWKQKLSKYGEIELKFQNILDRDFMQINALIQSTLIRLDRSYFSESVSVILRELLVNANRANAKRLYFEKNDIDINKDYLEGMDRFKAEILNYWSERSFFLKDSNYFIRIKLKLKKDETIIIEVINNAPLLEIEKKRILSRIAESDKYKNIMEAYRDNYDSSESAGLGLIMSILLMRNMGLDKSMLHVDSNERETSFRIEIPWQIIPEEVSNQILVRILDEVKMLPSLPQSLTKIIEICQSENMDMKRLVDEIERNPAVSADVLKLANSAGLINYAKKESVAQAVRKIGSNAILKMLYAISAVKIMTNRFGKMEEEWSHAGRTSFFAVRLAKDNNLTKLADSVSIGSLLHDIGKILLLSLEPDGVKLISSFMKNRSTENTKVIEESSIGISHSRLGAMLGEKWNFPEDLIAAIEFHQQPYMAPEPFKKNSEIVYIANMMANRVAGTIHYYSLDEDILREYGIDSREDFESTVEKYERAYQLDLKESNKH
ncbi:MAG: HDOD domain-containing protein [Leptospiraceae bacterium]|nr:HDOD domain-containing protein [Leptospiraceae bacterium]